MKMPLALAFAAVLTVPAFAQQTGVSQPPETVQDIPPAAPSVPVAQAAPATDAVPAAKPSAAVAYGEYRPYGSAPVLKSRPVENDPDAGIVIDVPRKEDELPAGTQVRMRLNRAIDTTSTQPDTPFTAEVVADIMTDRKVVIPAGSTVEGRITQVRGGKRIRGAALIHLNVDDVLMPDGTRLTLRAQVIDTDQFANTRVDQEGDILRKDHVGATLSAMSLTTGGAAAAGGILGGPAGALIGAGVGAGLSTAVWLKQDRQARLPEGTEVVLGLTEPMDLTRADFASAPGGPRLSPPPAGSVHPDAVADQVQPAGTPYVAPQAFVPTN